MTTESLHARCCVVGGGPAGMMLGFLLARAGIEVVVLEKHADFLRDFRGDTIHPSTLELMHELGLLERFLRRPHTEAPVLHAAFGGTDYPLADFTHLPTRAKFIALMPQWDFLDFLAGEARRYAGFRLFMSAEATELIEQNGRIRGVRVTMPDGPHEIHADLVVACDGRHSTLRERARIAVQDIGAPIDVLWFRLPRKPEDPGQTMGRFEAGRIFVLIDRGDYWQCAYVIAKGSFEAMKDSGLPAFRAMLAQHVPFFADRVDELTGWDQVKLLTVTVKRLTQWHRPGLLCIGDAAHAMSTVGGVGINLAIQDAVAAANILAVPLATGTPDDADLARVQARREYPTKVTQALQVFVQNNVLRRVLATGRSVRAPWPLRLMARVPLLRRLPARLIGLGVRPEHIGTPDVGARADG